MILSTLDSGIASVYSKFETFILKHFNFIVLEESIRNNSYQQLPILKLFCAFELIDRLTYMVTLTDTDGNFIYELEDLLVQYDIYNVAAELKKINIDINDIIGLFTEGFEITTNLEPFMNNNTIKYRLNKLTVTTLIQQEEVISDEPINVYRGTTRFLSIFAGYDNQPRPYIQNEWSYFKLSIRKAGVAIINYEWDNIGTNYTNDATPTSTAGEITFTLTPALITTLTADGLYDMRVYFEDLDGNSDIFDNTNAINILT